MVFLLQVSRLFGFMDQKLDRALYAVDYTGLMLDFLYRALPRDVDQLPYFFRFHLAQLRQHFFPHSVGGEVAPLTLAFGIDQLAPLLVGKVGGLGMDDCGCLSAPIPGMLPPD